MKNWEAIAQAHGLDLSARELERVAPPLDALEETFRPLVKQLTPEIEPAVALHLDGGSRVTIREAAEATPHAPLFRRGTDHGRARAHRAAPAGLRAFITVTASRPWTRRGRRTANSRPGTTAARSTAFRSRSRICSAPRACAPPAGSKVYENFVPEINATVVDKLHAGGRRNARQAQHARAGLRDHFGQSALRPGAQSVESGAQSGRLERRFGRRRGDRRWSSWPWAAIPAARFASPRRFAGPSG